VRIVEKDLKLLCEYLLEKKRTDSFKCLERNINKRGVKYPHFAFTFKTGTTCETAKEINDVSLSGEDARVILANASEIEESGAGELLDGVLFRDRLIPHHNELSVQILKTLHAGTELTPEIESEGVRGFSEHTVINLLFYSLNEICRFGRDESKTKSDVQVLQKWVETYYHVNLLMFPIDKAFTPYKAKLIMFPILLESGKIRCLYEHLTEATENSNHGVNNLYHNHSMRDGGFQSNMSSEFEDIFSSFVKSVKLAADRNLQLAFVHELSGGKTDAEINEECRELYLDICRIPVPTPKLDLSRKENFFRGMKFFICGTFEELNPFIFDQKLIKRVTKSHLESVITALNGEVVSDSMFSSMSESYSKLNHSYFVIQNDSFFKSFKRGCNGIPSKFIQSTRGDWIYIRAQYFIDVYQQNCFLDPESYLIMHDSQNFVKSRAWSLTRHTARQRKSTDTGPAPILAKTALKRSRSITKKSMANARQRTRNLSEPRPISRTAFRLFQTSYAQQQKDIYTNPDDGTVDLAALSARASQFWKSSQETRENYMEIARGLTNEKSPPTKRHLLNEDQEHQL
jgi:hypothetical protein